MKVRVGARRRECQLGFGFGSGLRLGLEDAHGVTGVPSRMAFSRVRRMVGSLPLTVLTLFFCSMLRIHLLACPCGSMARGHRLPRVARMPFSVE